MSFLNVTGFLALGLVPPLVLLYILKFRRQRKAVASTMLWQQVITDLRANTPFQKLRRNLLLLLQVLTLLLLVAALAAPVVSATLSEKKKFVIVIIDSSASMQSSDADGSRLDAAKKKALDVIGSLPAEAEAMVIDAGEQPLVVGNFTTDRSLARRAIEGINARDAEGRLADAVTLAYNNLIGMRAKEEKPGALPPGEIYLFSDGSNFTVPDLKNLDKIMKYIKVGAHANNVGITAFDARMVPGAKDEPPSFTVSVEVTNSYDTAREVFLSLHSGKSGVIVNSQRITVPPGKSEFAFFVGLQLDFSQGDMVELTARLEQKSGEKDDLAVDNTAYAVVRKPRQLQVLVVSEGSPAIERYFEVNTATSMKEIGHAEYDPAKAAGFDLIVFDHFVPGVLPKCDCFFIEPETTLDGKKRLDETTRPSVDEWNSEDPLFDHVKCESLAIYLGRPFPLEAGDEALIRSQRGALMARRTVDDSVYIVSAFDPHFSSWGQDPAFVIFMENLVNSVLAHRQIGAARSFKAGEPVEFDGNAGRIAECGATTPDGRKAALTASAGRICLYDTERAGFYAANIIGLDNNSGRRDFGVSTLSRAETLNAPVDKMELGGGGEIKAVTVPRANIDVWPYLALVAALVVIFEWWAFTRRS